MGEPADAFLAALDPEQRAVALAVRGPVCVRAGAGTGKTRAIIYRIAQAVRTGVVRPQNILAVTFTARAAGEMRSRLRSLGIPDVQARTFHSAALSQLRYFWPVAIGGHVPEIKESKAALVAEAATRLGMPTDAPTIRDLSAEIEWAKVSLITPEDYAFRARQAGRIEVAAQMPEAIGQLIAKYEEVKTERAVIDFEDVILVLIGIMLDRPDIARAIRAQYRYFVVDEYQDVSPMQHRLLQLWLGESRDLCVVGDAEQTIYSFTGASSRYLAGFTREFRGAQEIVLDRNYRSTPQIIALANELVKTDAGMQAVTLHAMQPAGAAVHFRDFPSPSAEADAIAAQIKQIMASPAPAEVAATLAKRPDGGTAVSGAGAVSPSAGVVSPDAGAAASRDGAARAASDVTAAAPAGVPLSRIAILYRTNSQSEEFERALTHAGIPYALQGAESFFQRASVREAMVALRSEARSGISQNSADNAALPSAPLPLLVEDVLRAMGWRPEGPEARGASRERWESLTTILELARTMQREKPRTLREFVKELEERAEFHHVPAVPAVTLASLHAAKGLEWEVVFLAGMAEGLLPISYARTPAQIAEEKRLLYVGVTRARAELFVSWAQSGGARGAGKVSRFLAPLWPQPVSRATAARRRAHAQEQALLAGEPAVFQTYQRLQHWRDQVAQARGVAPYRVVRDGVLRAVATANPQNLVQLAAVRNLGQRTLLTYGDQILQVLHNG